MNEWTYHPTPRLSHEPSYKKKEVSDKPLWQLPKKDSLRTRQIPSRQVICFDCGALNTIPKTALSAHCTQCASYIKIDKVVLGPRSHRTLTKTWGDVIVLPQSVLNNYFIHCQNLILDGKLSGEIECSNKCIIKCNQHFLGTLQCHNLAIMKKIRVIAANPIQTVNAHIFGTLQGDIQAQGAVIIHKNGQILGDITAEYVQIEEGGIHHGKKHVIQHYS